MHIFVNYFQLVFECSKFLLFLENTCISNTLFHIAQLSSRIISLTFVFLIFIDLFPDNETAFALIIQKGDIELKYLN